MKGNNAVIHTTCLYSGKYDEEISRQRTEEAFWRLAHVLHTEGEDYCLDIITKALSMD